MTGLVTRDTKDINLRREDKSSLDFLHKRNPITSANYYSTFLEVFWNFNGT
jgi:hypothetical protein